MHGDLGQGAREQALRAFRSGKIDVLVATDVAARGIDVQDVTHVINYQCPDEERTFLLMYLREFANADGVLPADFDAVVRESFGDVLDAAYS